MELGFLEVHLQMMHGKKTGGRRNWDNMAPCREQCTYKIYFPTAGAPKEFPHRGLLRMGGDTDGDVGPLFPLVCPGYHDYTGGGHPPPPTVILVRHAGALAGAERAASIYFSVHQEGGEITEEEDGRGAAGEC